jgi:NAD(P)-dependent dehydrogenase (short-subunit alcohol dehydrogenase family)
MTETVVISGADKGLGFALTTRFLHAGFRVFAGAYSSSSSFSALLQKFPETLTVLPLDVTDMQSIREAVKRVAEHAPALDILINNAGVHIDTEETPLEELDFTDQHLEKTMAVNAFGPLRMLQQFLPLLAQGRRKLLLNISSESGSITDAKREKVFAYCMSKAALNMQSKLLQNYLGPRGFKVLAIQPGWMRTDMGGPNAEIAPEESAEGIFTLAMQDWTPQDMIYLDYQGNPLPW